uniref:Uncharacterized protein n=1 Tax=Glossina brevipalpis TaxID=37001 RepID=A0A1A9W4P2_9MUSC
MFSSPPTRKASRPLRSYLNSYTSLLYILYIERRGSRVAWDGNDGNGDGDGVSVIVLKENVKSSRKCVAVVVPFAGAGAAAAAAAVVASAAVVCSGNNIHISCVIFALFISCLALTVLNSYTHKHTATINNNKISKKYRFKMRKRATNHLVSDINAYELNEDHDAALSAIENFQVLLQDLFSQKTLLQN